MKNEHDIIIIGAGHNGLATAAYLAKAGLDVCVLEKNPWIGGGCVTQELAAPGFKNDPASTCHIFIQANPLLVNDELGLKSKYGLKFHYPDSLYSVVFPDDSSYTCYRDVEKTCAMIEKRFSARDADAYRKFYDWASAGLDMLTPAFYAPCPPAGDLFAMLQQSGPGRELMRALMMSSLQLLDDWFENDFVKIAIARFTTEVIISPQEAGTGVILYMMTPFVHRYGIGLPEGGSGALTDKLEACLKDLGATIRTQSGVKRITVAGGAAKGVVLESGEEIRARKAVVSAVHVQQLVLQMLRPEQLSPDVTTMARRIKMNPFSLFHQVLAMHEAPRYKAGDEVDKSCIVEFAPGNMPEFRQHFEDFHHGRVRTDGPLMMTQSLFDPTRAPAGKHSGYLLHYAPYHLREGAAHWDRLKDDLAAGVLAHLQRRTTNMGEANILGRKVFSPLDFERWNSSFVEGDGTHIGNYLFQSLSMRPMPGWGHYRTPVDKLYMTGASTHPGGGISAGSGRAAAQVVCQDLGISFETLVA
ncbi:phytoene desaturase family protein [Sorangium sp. So ce124]|uniref:phytoene desaturase family protein n=1 Tax=Sorangium sp. So ce124 TaxID=3133280 RepID=UPI003F5F238C